jgi:HAD superfamily hydrolase (TIGR01549 family)
MYVVETVSVILLDMNSTFMFGEDRFSESEDYYHTYRSVGGNRLSPKEVRHAIQACYQGMSSDYENPDNYAAFPTLEDGFRQYSQVENEDLPHLIDTFACHELGHVANEYAQFLKNLAQTNALGLVANIWAPRNRWLTEFVRAGIQDVFTTMVFSSDIGCIKPSPVIYAKALQGLHVPHSEVLFVGDSLKYDVQGAKQMGFNTVWINRHHTNHPMADYVIPSLLHLDRLPAEGLNHGNSNESLD